MSDPLYPPSLTAPPLACDTHMHVYEEGYPLAPTASSRPLPATLESYRAVQQRLGLARAVVVQPTAYGFDNRCTLDATARLGEAARAVVVVNDTVTDRELERLTAAGARAARFHLMPGALLSWDTLRHLAPRLAEHGWVTQVQFNGREFPEHIAQLMAVPGTLVIDHVGKFSDPVPPDHPAFRLLLDLVAQGRTYVKLSAAYEISRTGAPDYADVAVLATALVKSAPDRMMWASNWPHPGLVGPARPDDANLLDRLLDWAPDPAIRTRILVDNPAACYGF